MGDYSYICPLVNTSKAPIYKDPSAKQVILHLMKIQIYKFVIVSSYVSFFCLNFYHFYHIL